MYLGDFKEDGDLFFKFTTRAFATGIPGTLGSTPVLSVYIDEGTSPKTTAESYFDLDVDFNSKTGLNNVRIDLSGDAFFATGADYAVVITTGTVDSVSVVGETVATFSIENRSMGRPAGATLADDIASVKSTVDNVENGVGIIVADTNELQTDWTNGGRLDLLLDAIPTTAMRGTDSAATAANLTTVDGVVDAIKVVTDKFVFTSAGRVDSNVEALNNVTGPAAQLEQNLANCFTGTASGTPTTTTMISDIGVTVDDQFNGRIITFDDDTTTAALRGQSTDITGCTAASNTLTFTATTTAPVSGDKFTIT